MKRIAIWGAVGFAVAVAWMLYFMSFPQFASSRDPMMVLVELSCPIALLRSYPIHLSVVLLANTLTYAMVGAIVEAFRHRVHHAR